MYSAGDFTVTHSSATPDPKNCSLISIIPIVGMSSCRGRAEAFARRLSSKLRTLGSQDDDDTTQEDEPIINGRNTNTWLTGDNGGEHIVTDIQPLRNESDTFFDFDCELESPGSPVDECEYLRLIESASNTPHDPTVESGCACVSAASSNSSTDAPLLDLNDEMEARTSQQQQQLQENTTSNQSTEMHDTTTPDEVDCCTMSKSETGHSNGYHAHKDLIKTLPCEGPDIETRKVHTQTCYQEIPKQISMTHMVQQQILKELQKQSLEYSDDELEQHNKRYSKEFACESAEDMTVEQVIKQECQHTDHITNGRIKMEQGTETEAELLLPATKEEFKIETSNGEERLTVVDSNENEIIVIKIEPEDKSCETENETTKNSHLNMATTDDDEDCRPQRVRRCSSLKTGKTPPGTPGQKKIVRFADVLGLDLADVKTFLDEIPNIPRSAYEDLEILDTEPPVQLGPKVDKMLMPLFQQPAGLPNFLDIVREKLVSLENAAVTDAINQTITGSVRVRNLDFHKSVHIRYSLDGWRSFADLQANYVENSCDGFSDKFTFILFGNSLHVGQRLEFAVRFQCKGQQYWDNNYGANYCFQCLPTTAPVINTITAMLPSHHSNHMGHTLSPVVGDSWSASFY